MEGRTPSQCMFRWRTKLQSSQFNKGRWTFHEDGKLVLGAKAFPPDTSLATSYGYIRKKPKHFWADISKCVKTRGDAACRERFTSGLDGNVTFGTWTPEEDAELLHVAQKVGMGKWSQISRETNLRRTDGQVAKRWRILQERMRAKKAKEDAKADTTEMESGSDAPPVLGNSKRDSADAPYDENTTRKEQSKKRKRAMSATGQRGAQSESSGGSSTMEPLPVKRRSVMEPRFGATGF